MYSNSGIKIKINNEVKIIISKPFAKVNPANSKNVFIMIKKNFFILISN